QIPVRNANHPKALPAELLELILNLLLLPGKVYNFPINFRGATNCQHIGEGAFGQDEAIITCLHKYAKSLSYKIVWLFVQFLISVRLDRPICNYCSIDGVRISGLEAGV